MGKMKLCIILFFCVLIVVTVWWVEFGRDALVGTWVLEKTIELEVDNVENALIFYKSGKADMDGVAAAWHKAAEEDKLIIVYDEFVDVREYYVENDMLILYEGVENGGYAVYRKFKRNKKTV